jgi:hypothetical protein
VAQNPTKKTNRLDDMLDPSDINWEIVFFKVGCFFPTKVGPWVHGKLKCSDQLKPDQKNNVLARGSSSSTLGTKISQWGTTLPLTWVCAFSVQKHINGPKHCLFYQCIAKSKQLYQLYQRITEPN